MEVRWDHIIIPIKKHILFLNFNSLVQLLLYLVHSNSVQLNLLIVLIIFLCLMVLGRPKFYLEVGLYFQAFEA